MKGRAIAWLPQELDWIEERKHLPRVQLHELFCAFWQRDDVSLAAISALCKRNGWLTGRTGCFVKGQVPMNKGQTMPFNAASAATRFQKGHRPHTWRGAGHESIDPKDGYVWRIVAETNPHTGAPTRRVMKHKWLWELQNGAIPHGMRLKCLDGNRTNTDPSNWSLVPDAIAPRLNGRYGRGYDRAPAELKPAIMAITQLEHAARERRKATVKRPRSKPKQLASPSPGHM